MQQKSLIGIMQSHTKNSHVTQKSHSPIQKNSHSPLNLFDTPKKKKLRKTFTLTQKTPPEKSSHTQQKNSHTLKIQPKIFLTHLKNPPTHRKTSFRPKKRSPLKNYAHSHTSPNLGHLPKKLNHSHTQKKNLAKCYQKPLTLTIKHLSGTK